MILATLCGCGGRSRPPGEEEIAQAFSGQGAAPTPPRAKYVEIYVDASMSIAGFVAESVSSHSKYILAVQRLIQALQNQKQWDVSRYSFGRGVRSETHDLWVKYQTSDFYSELETDFPKLLKRFSDGNPDSTIYVIVSDLVQSRQSEKSGYNPY